MDEHSADFEAMADHSFDQFGALAVNIAHLLAVYYSSLRSNGIDGESALQLVRDFANLYWERLLDHADDIASEGK